MRPTMQDGNLPPVTVSWVPSSDTGRVSWIERKCTMATPREHLPKSRRGTPRTSLNLKIHPLTPKRWQDLETLFGRRGACGGCWCMWWRLKSSTFEKQKGTRNRTAFKRIVAAGEVPGLLGYLDGQPIAWCALARREIYGRLERSRILKPVDDQPVWSVPCFFIAKPYRRKGISVELLQAALKHARRCGASIVEGYPVEPEQRYADAFAYVGLASAFRQAGFVEVARRSPTRPIMRYVLKPSRRL